MSVCIDDCRLSYHSVFMLLFPRIVLVSSALNQRGMHTVVPSWSRSSETLMYGTCTLLANEMFYAFSLLYVFYRMKLVCGKLRGIYVTKRTATPFRTVFLRSTRAGTAFHLFTGIDITSTFRSPTKFWVTPCVAEPILFTKIALYMGVFL